MVHHVEVAANALTAEDLLKGTFGTAGHFNTNVYPSDQMLTFVASVIGNEEIARGTYFRSGAQLMDIVAQLVEWKFGSFDKVEAFLDFASGYGRLTRFLVQQLPADRIWVSDIQANAVAFQVEQLGVHGFLSEMNPADLDRAGEFAEKFDCIFVASLFSHLPERTFIPWLRKLYSMLKPDGLLMFSVHDEILLDPSYQMPESGFIFREDSEIAELDTRDYGVTFVTEAFVSKAVEEATGGRTAYHRIRRMMYLQDLYVLVKSDQPDFSGLKFEYGAGGTVDYCYWRRRDELCVNGWTVDITPGSAIKEITFFVNGEVRQKCMPYLRRPDVRTHFKDEAFLYSGWECFCRVPGGTDTDLLTVTARTTTGNEYLLYAGSIAAILRPGAGDEASLSSMADPAYIDQMESTLERKNLALLGLEGYARRLEAELKEARTPKLPWKRRTGSA
ncbi:MAG TPA: class I SAM-dependent methyltransferase [Chloroflexia bacterium]|nr:class I SAM-dependent methyltransferase [Chloroflexia bacterium]